MYAVYKEAAEYAHSGKGAVLIEALTYRKGAHTTSDDPTKYRTREEELEWEITDPILRLKKYMDAKGIWKENEEELIEQYKLAVDSQHSSSQIDLYLYHKLRPLDSLKFTENLNETKVFITGSDYIIAKDYTNLLSFWIRRHIDGSANQIHETIIYYLSKFDKEWLDRNR